MTRTLEYRTRSEDALKHIFGWEKDGVAIMADSLAGALTIRRGIAADLLGELGKSGWLEMNDAQWALTPAGREYALHIIRAHRLYETYLATTTGLPPKEWHAEAEKREHQLSPGEVDELARELGHPRFDPHGDPIPTREGEMPTESGVPLLGKTAGWVGRIDHLEDEPETVFSLLTEAELHAGMRVRVECLTPQGIELLIDGRISTLTPVMAANVRVCELNADESPDEQVSRLTDLAFQQQATVVGLTTACRGAERRRLLDLGVVPGSSIVKELSGPFNSPAAFRIRGSLIALRERQTEYILIKDTQEENK